MTPMIWIIGYLIMAGATAGYVYVDRDPEVAMFVGAFWPLCIIVGLPFLFIQWLKAQQVSFKTASEEK